MRADDVDLSKYSRTRLNWCGKVSVVEKDKFPIETELYLQAHERAKKSDSRG